MASLRRGQEVMASLHRGKEVMAPTAVNLWGGGLGFRGIKRQLGVREGDPLHLGDIPDGGHSQTSAGGHDPYGLHDESGGHLGAEGRRCGQGEVWLLESEQ